RGLLGRPRLNISPETLQWFVDCGYSAVGIAECLGLHPNTIRQRLNEHQLGRRDRYSSISDEDLDQWGFIVFGGIDGFSRKIVLLGVSNNNRSETLLSMFENAVAQHGIPSRLRTDKGGEHRGIAEFMVFHRGDGRRSHIAGRSVHNQRCVSSLHYSLFRQLEDRGLLDPDNEHHIFALQHVSQARIQQSLD
ncbi:hypothetical protein CRUP_029541, partial [Coryphaenoides rupestris]